MTYTDNVLAAASSQEAGLDLAFWNGKQWVLVFPCEGCALDRANKRVSVNLNHLTEFVFRSEGQHNLLLPLVAR